MLLFRVLVLILAVAGGVSAVIAHRRSAGLSTTQWGTRASVLLSLAIFVGTLPAVVFPSATWLSWTGSLLSLALTAASWAMLRRQRRASQLHASHLGS